jgi:predicted RNase H-like nuclease
MSTDCDTAREPEFVVVGFDSAWADNPKKPGAICAVVFEGGRPLEWHEPLHTGFAGALDFIRRVERPRAGLLLALDQPTIVRNTIGARPVDKTAGSLISWLGGGVQPANTGKRGFFDEAAAIWSFLDLLSAKQQPEEARTGAGRYVMEVFPALALVAFQTRFFARLGGPRYNPERRKTFSLANWIAVLDAVEAEAVRLGCPFVREWLADLPVETVRKGDQDRLDAIICLLVGIRWRFSARSDSVMIGCTDHGYMVSPVTPAMYERISAAASARGVPVDGLLVNPQTTA